VYTVLLAGRAAAQDSTSVPVWRDAAIGGAFFAAAAVVSPFDTRLAMASQRASLQRSTFLRDGANGFDGVGVPGTFVLALGFYAGGWLADDRGIATLGLHGGEALAASTRTSTGRAMCWSGPGSGRRLASWRSSTARIRYCYRGDERDKHRRAQVLAAFAERNGVLNPRAVSAGVSIPLGLPFVGGPASLFLITLPFLSAVSCESYPAQSESHCEANKTERHSNGKREPIRAAYLHQHSGSEQASPAEEGDGRDAAWWIGSL
jgi:hypothetical protein